MASAEALGCAARDPGAGGVLTSCPAGPQPRPSSWQRCWPRMSCSLVEALSQVFAALVGLPGGYGAWVFQQLEYIHGILAGCFCASGFVGFYYSPFFCATNESDGCRVLEGSFSVSKQLFYW